MTTTVNLSDYSRDVLMGLKEKKDHKNYDSALREIFYRCDIDENELIEIAREAEEKKEKEKLEDEQESLKHEEQEGNNKQEVSESLSNMIDEW